MKISLPRGFQLFALGTLLIALVSGLALRGDAASRNDRSLAALSLVSSLRSAIALQELEEARSNALLWGDFGGLIRALRELERSWVAMGPDAAAQLERIYLRNNPHPEGERFLLTDPGDGSPYSAIHADLQPRVREFLEIHGYDDLLLVNGAGRVVYSFGKEEDFATDLLQGPLRDTGLARVARAVPSLREGSTAIADFEPYAARDGDWALFIGAPISAAGSGADQGALVLQLSPERIGNHLTRTDQQRRSSTSFILGDGYRLLGEAPWIELPDPSDPVAAEARIRAREGGAGSAILRARDGTRVLAAWEPITFEGVRWVVVSQVDLTAVQAEGAGKRRAVIVVTLLLWLSFGVLTLGRQGGPVLGRHTV